MTDDNDIDLVIGVMLQVDFYSESLLHGGCAGGSEKITEVRAHLAGDLLEC